MKYEGPIELSEEEIILGLSNQENTQDEWMIFLLSSVFYCPTQLAGDLLIKELEEANYTEKHFVTNLFTSFYAIHRTTYRIDESINLLQMEKIKTPLFSAEIEENIQELLEHKTIFQNSDNQSK